MGTQDLHAGWETVLLANLTSRGVVRGRVRAHKLLAFLQLHGVPVPIRFHNIRMGPSSLEVDRRARKAESNGLLELKKEVGKAEFERNDYETTALGRQYMRNEILPALQELSYGQLVIDAVANVAETYLYAKDQVLVDTIHRELHLDDRDELIEVYEATLTRLKEWQDANSGMAIRDSVVLAALATVDFARMALDAIKPILADEDQNSTGPYNILYNAERLAWLLDSVDPLHSKQHKGDGSLVKRFDKILNGMERNAEIYGLVHVPTDQEIDALFEEVAPSVPDPESA